MSICLNVCIGTTHLLGTCRVQKKSLEVQTVASYYARNQGARNQEQNPVLYQSRVLLTPEALSSPDPPSLMLVSSLAPSYVCAVPSTTLTVQSTYPL